MLILLYRTITVTFQRIYIEMQFIMKVHPKNSADTRAHAHTHTHTHRERENKKKCVIEDDLSFRTLLHLLTITFVTRFLDCNIHLLIWVRIYVSKHFFSNKNNQCILHFIKKKMLTCFLFLLSVYVFLIIIKMSSLT